MGEWGSGGQVGVGFPHPMPNAQCPMPNAQCPMPIAHCPFPSNNYLS
ncbi:histidine kinase [Tolypothrix sp. VBCCA 56010]